MIPVLLLHGEGPIIDFSIKAGIALPIIFAVLVWLAWWTGRGRYLPSRPSRVILRAAVALVFFWLTGLVAVVLGIALNVAVAHYAVVLWPESDGGPITFLGLFLLPPALLGGVLGWWATRGRPSNNELQRTRPAQAMEPRR